MGQAGIQTGAGRFPHARFSRFNASGYASSDLGSLGLSSLGLSSLGLGFLKGGLARLGPSINGFWLHMVASLRALCPNFLRTPSRGVSHPVLELYATARRFVNLVMVISTPGLCVFLVTCGGGGGGGGGLSGPTTSSGGGADILQPAPPAPSPSVASSVIQPTSYWLADSEYLANSNLEKIRAAASYASGATGAGQIIGFLDTGLAVSHPEFANIEGASRGDKVVYYNDAAIAGQTDRGRLNHGTSVASIAAGRHGSGYGMQGVAFDASIAMWAVGQNTSGLVVSPAILMAAYGALDRAEAGIINNSWGTRESYAPARHQSQKGSMHALFGESLNTIASGRAIHVMAAGNEGDDNVVTTAALPLFFDGLSGLMIAVTAVDENGQIDDDANRCGLAANFCISAPGGTHQLTGSTVAASAFGGYRRVRGTSFSAAYVSGALAVMKQKFGSQLSNPQYVSRLLQTAKKQGIYANRSIYGQGLLDLYSAITPVGSLEIPLPDGGTIPVRKIEIPSGVSTIPIPKTVTFNIVALDDLGDPFSISLMDLGQIRATGRRNLTAGTGGLAASVAAPLFASYRGATSSDALTVFSDPQFFSELGGWRRFSMLSLSEGTWMQEWVPKWMPKWVEGLDLVFNGDGPSATPDRVGTVVRVKWPFWSGSVLAIGREAQFDQFLGLSGQGLFSTHGTSYLDHVMFSQKLGRWMDLDLDADLSWSRSHFTSHQALSAGFSADQIVDLMVRFSNQTWSGYVRHRLSNDYGNLRLRVPTARNPDHTVNFEDINVPLYDMPQWSMAIHKKLGQADLFLQVQDHANDIDIRLGFARSF